MTYSLNVLGACDLTAEDELRVESVLQQPRRLALLVYLAIATRTGPVQRDTVLAVFWPESDTSAGRNALSQALHYLRRSLGDVVLSPTQNELLLDRHSVECDAALFLDAIDVGDWTKAAEIYSGELLPGFRLLRTPQSIEVWVEEQRSRLKRAAAEAAWRTSKACAESGDAAQAAVWARRAVEWSGNEELHVRHLMTLLNDLKDRAGVWAAYQELDRSLALLDCEPSEETRALLERYRQEWKTLDAAPEAASAAGSTTPPHPSGREVLRETKRSRWLWAGAAMLVVLLTALLWPEESSPPNVTYVEGVTLVFDSLTGDRPGSLDLKEIEWDLVNRLSSVSGVRVVTRSQIPEAANPLTFHLTARLVARNDSAWTHFRLVDPQSGAVAYSRRSPSGSLSDLTSDRVGLELSQAVRLALGELQSSDQNTLAARSTTAAQFLTLSSSTRQRGDSLAAAGLVNAAAVAYANGDSLAARAAGLAAAPPEIWVERSRIAFSQAWLAFQQGNMAAAVGYGRRALEFSEEALTREESLKGALEVRAEVSHWLWAATKQDPPADHSDLLLAADVAATVLTEAYPTYAKGWSLVGALAWSQGDFGRAYWALRHAIDQDRYLRDHVEITARLFQASWEVGDTAAAEGWCSQLDRLEPEGFLLRHCTLMLQAIAAHPDTTLIRRVLRSNPPPSRFQWQWRRLPFVAAVGVARAGDEHWARELIGQVTPDASDRDLLADAAWARLALGEVDLAHQLLGEATSGFKRTWLSTLSSRRFQDLERVRAD